MWWYSFFSLLFCCSLCADLHRELEINDIKRKYILHIPQGLEKEAPLVLFLHGAGGSAQGAAERYGWRQEADRESFIVVFLEGTPIRLDAPANFRSNPNLWNDGSGRGGKSSIDDIGFIRRVIEEVSKEHQVNPKQIYISGFSNGASMTFRAGIELSGMVAAIAPVMGHLFVTGTLKRPVSLLFISGGADNSVNAWVRMLNLSNTPKISTDTITYYGPGSQGQEVIFELLQEEKHQWPSTATETIWRFFKHHTL